MKNLPTGSPRKGQTASPLNWGTEIKQDPRAAGVSIAASVMSKHKHDVLVPKEARMSNGSMQRFQTYVSVAEAIKLGFEREAKVQQPELYRALINNNSTKLL